MLDQLQRQETSENQDSFQIEKSMRGQSWVFEEVDQALALSLSQKLSLPLILSELLIRRGLSFEKASDFLDPKLKNYLPDPSILKDMDKGAKRFYQAIRDNEKIMIFGDYDVDGATSSALLVNFLKSINIQADLYIPDRMIDGYGPNVTAFQRFIDDGVNLVVTVDCGTMAFESLALAKKHKMDVLVLDHHKAETKLPDAVAIINPNRVDEEISDLCYLAAVGVAYLFIIAVNRMLRTEKFYAQNNLPEPNMLSYLDLVALGTVCDVVPLKGLNRALVHQGLKIMSQRQNPGLTTLADSAKIDERLTPYHLGFILGPRINAGGRVGESYLGSQLLSHPGGIDAEKIANILGEYNKERKEIEADILEKSIEKVEALKLYEKEIIIVSGEGWHPGVIGIVASRLKDKYWRPVCVIGIDEKGIGKSSGRSISGLDLGTHILAANQDGYLLNGGGHEMAVGFSIESAKISTFEDYLITRIQKDFPDGLPKRMTKIDGILSASGIQLDLIEQLEKLAPYGTGNPEPLFVVKDAQIEKVTIVGQDHLRCIIKGSKGGENIQRSLIAMSFRSVGTRLGDFLQNAVQGQPIQLLGKMKINEFRGNRSAQFIIEDAAV